MADEGAGETERLSWAGRTAQDLGGPDKPGKTRSQAAATKGDAETTQRELRDHGTTLRDVAKPRALA